MPAETLHYEGIDKEPMTKALRRGEATAGRTHECVHCGRPIHKSERCWFYVELVVDNSYRAVTSTYSCCKEI